jgi:spore maturation protein CgeB
VAAGAIPQIVRQSVISLNFGDSGLHVQGLKVYRSRQIKARVFEVPGAGGCLLTESAESLDKYYRLGSEIEVFEGIDDLAEKIRYLLANPEYRDALAQAGYQRTRSEHVYEIRFADLMTRLSKRDKYEAIDWTAFEAIAARHCVGSVEKLLRAILTMPFRLAWGVRRGPRAARRLVFECSWRLFGRRTYTAAGWPGRWFYRES